MPIALFLAGGGAKRSFQFGALQAALEGLVREHHLIHLGWLYNALQLSHDGHSGETQKAALEKLKSIWETKLTPARTCTSRLPGSLLSTRRRVDTLVKIKHAVEVSI